MFNFDGEFRRRPQQNLGGASQKTDRLTVIRKAQQERQKREEARRQQNGAIVIQSAVRSFIQRQQTKHRERGKFDEYRKANGIRNGHDLEYLTKRILFFYQQQTGQDGDRLIFLCQYMIKNPGETFKHVASEVIWTYRIKRLLGLCLGQILVPDHSPTIPMRMLEIYSSNTYISKHLPPGVTPNQQHQAIQQYLTTVYGHLIEHRYFHVVRQLIEEKVPSIDTDTTTMPHPIADALFDMLLRPLKLVQPDPLDALSRQILQSFTFNVLSSTLSDQMKHFILSTLGEREDFPYWTLVRCIADEYQAQLDRRSAILIDLTDDLTRKSGTPKKARRNQSKDERLRLTSSLLYAFLKLDERHTADKTNSKVQFGAYLKVIASMMDNINKLPRKTIRSSINRPLGDSSDSESDSEDVPALSPTEGCLLQDIIGMLNESRRVAYIVRTIDTVLDEPVAVQNLCQICHQLMTYNRMAVYEYKLLYMLASKPVIIRSLWYTLMAHSDGQMFTTPIVLLSKGLNISKEDSDRTIPVLASFCALFGRLIASLHDGEFVQENVLPGTVSSIMPFSIAELIPLSTTLKEISLGLVELAFPETRSFLHENYRTMISSLTTGTGTDRSNSGRSRYEPNRQIWPHLLKVCVSLLRQIHTRDLRRCFCPEGHWTAQNLNLPLDKPTDLHLSRGSRRNPRPFQPIRDFTREDVEDGPPLSTKQIRSITILREIPFVVPFNTRVGVFQGLVAADKLRTQGDLQGFLQGPSTQMTVRRSHLYEDAFDKLSPTNEPDIRPKFRIEMVNSVGLREAGIDGGGVFREFLSELIKLAFDPHRGFFMITKDNMLYPNPSVGKIVEDFQRHYYFIGRILGKALYENLLVELPLAEFFLSKLAGKHSDVDVHQLASLDPILYRNLMSLKAYEGDVADLGLDFTIVCDALGETRVEELKPNGANIIVNTSNRIEYIQLMADFKLNQQIRAQCAAFRQGLANVLPIEWLYMFSNKELQVLISGAEIPVDVHDLRKHTRYGGDFSLEHHTIQLFWKVVEQFDDIQRRLLLKFVTSCSRPPLLGFKDLDPPFFIQNAGDTDRLPSASTCMNLLKLPAFEEEDILREKLLYAIQSGAGFELS
ncbi:ubiquitin-protein ligase E3C [Anopheles ziemanni]|uniref:ubiquitin-protein ligase E3C n=1 Tax=Anopheles coustani TaxID=139045 RepID=UPI00265AB5F1|nr:ubiquitin-protein ligase E3C [Anopheles coustani]XP_058171147.1 ubiquitin-protein ligase E3C [Anopheles ziemanni]